MSTPRTRQTAEGTLVIVGGHEDKSGECVILKRIASAARGKGPFEPAFR